MSSHSSITNRRRYTEPLVSELRGSPFPSPTRTRAFKDGYAMKIQCQSCQAKYTIVDGEGLEGLVKHRRKKCSSTIVINGNDQGSLRDVGGGDNNAFDYAAGAATSGRSTSPMATSGPCRSRRSPPSTRAVFVNDGQTYCWKDGMADWLPLRYSRTARLGEGGRRRWRRRPHAACRPSASVPPPAAAPLFGGSTVPADAFAGSEIRPKPANGGAGVLQCPGGRRRLRRRRPVVRAAAPRALYLFGNAREGGRRGRGRLERSRGRRGGGEPRRERRRGRDHRREAHRSAQRELGPLLSLRHGQEGLPGGGRWRRRRRPRATTRAAYGSGLIDIRALERDTIRN